MDTKQQAALEKMNQLKAEQKEFWYPFEGYETDGYRFRLKGTSKKTIRAVSEIMAGRPAIGEQARAGYAQQAGIKPVGQEERTINGVVRLLNKYELDDIYDEYWYAAFLAEALFEGFPQLVQVIKKPAGDGNSIEYDFEILNQELFDALEEGEINRAFLLWNMKRAGQ